MRTKEDNLPSVSVIIPAFNAENNIADLLESLLEQNYPKELYEIVVVDNNSTDRTRKIVRGYPVKLLEEKEVQSSYAARNKGLRNSLGEVIAFIDSDEVAGKNWLRVGCKCSHKEKADLAGGEIVIVKGKKETLWSIFDQLVYLNQEKYVKDGWAATANLFVNKHVFSKVGLFNHNLVSGGDNEFTRRATSAGYRLVYCPMAVTYHAVRGTFSSHVKKSLRLGMGKAQICKSTKKRFSFNWSLHFLALPLYVLYLLFKRREEFRIIDVILLPIVAFVVGLSYSYGYLANYLQPGKSLGGKSHKPARMV